MKDNEKNGASRKVSIIAALIFGGCLTMSFLMTPGWDTGFTICHWKSMTGTPCLACGLTHAFVYLSHGQVSHAVDQNPLALIVYPFFYVGLIWSMACVFGLAKGPGKIPRWLQLSLLVAVVVGWIARIAWG
jgi:uncharacterized protein DUF2752